MFRQAITLVSRRSLSFSPVRRNLVSDLYIQQIKAFKPTPLSASEIESSVKAFQLPSKPSPPSEDISAEALSQYEAAEVETAEAGAPEGAVAVEEDWFVFEEADDGHH